MGVMRLSYSLACAALLTAWGLQAAPLYRIDFTGTVRSGSVSGILFDQSPYLVDFTPGETISGTLFIDTALLPAATISGGPSFTTTYSDTGLTQWLTGVLNLPIPALPANALPVPSLQSLDRTPAPSPGDYSQPPALQQFLSVTTGGGCCSAILPTVSASDVWGNSSQLVARSVLLGLLITSTTQFLADVPGIPSSFVATNLGAGSTVQIVNMMRDATNLTPPNFGIASNYALTITFDTTSASGGYFQDGGADVPEPSTFWMLAAAPVLLLLRRRS